MDTLKLPFEPRFITLTLAVLISSASAGAFNQYYEHDTDPLMSRWSPL